MRSALCSILAAMIAVATFAGSSSAQEVRTGGPVSITLRGFVSATMFAQDGNFAFGNGQNAIWVLHDPERPAPTEDEWLLGGDVRNTRLTLALTGPVIARDWRAGGTLELDFFGGFVGTGPFSDEQPMPRLRLAYVDLTRGGTTVRIGQNWAPLFGNVPVSTSHIGFPLGYGGGGLIGWRFPGIFLYQNLTETDAPVRAQLQLAAMKGSWNAPGNVLEQQSAGEAATIPQLQARLDFTGRTEGITWGSYLVGHWDRKDLSGVGPAVPGADDELTGRAIEIGARLAPGPLTLHGNAYWGRAIAQQIAQLLQFGDIGGWGAWGQVGYQFTPSWSAWLFYGTDDPEDEDIRALPLASAPRLLNRSVAAMLRYGSGPYQIGAEWMRSTTDWRTGPTTGDVRQEANQIALSVFFAF